NKIQRTDIPFGRPRAPSLPDPSSKSPARNRVQDRQELISRLRVRTPTGASSTSLRRNDGKEKSLRTPYVNCLAVEFSKKAGKEASFRTARRRSHQLSSGCFRSAS